MNKLHFTSKALSRICLTLLAPLLLTGALSLRCSSVTKPSAEETPLGPRVSIMSYNVENLFDTEHDEGKDDHTYLPLALKKPGTKFRSACEAVKADYRRKECLETDWNDEVLEKKMNRIADVVAQIGNSRGPDILILIEVENKKVLEELRTKHLKASGYTTSILLEGPDQRGIDTAILSRLPEWDKARLHILPLKAEKKEDEYAATSTRGILEARLELPDGQRLAVFAAHLPSQANPSYLRKQAVEHLNKLEAELPPGTLAIAGGDFNITREEDQATGYFSRVLETRWTVSHLVGCKKCEGTHYYHPKREWSFLDALLFSDAMGAGEGAAWKLDPASIRTPNESRYQVNKHGSPARFDETSGVGISDHWPIYAEIYKPVAK